MAGLWPAQSHWQGTAPSGQREEDSVLPPGGLPTEKVWSWLDSHMLLPSFAPGSVEPHPEPERGEMKPWATPPAGGPIPDLHTLVACSPFLRSYRQGTTSHDPILFSSSHLAALGLQHLHICIPMCPFHAWLPDPRAPTVLSHHSIINSLKADDQTASCTPAWHRVSVP